MSDVRIEVEWSRQKVDFESDGSLRDIYVQQATVEDWKRVGARVLDGDHRAQLQRGDTVVSMPSDFEAVFGSPDAEQRYFMRFVVGGVSLDCHFFTPDEIEFSFWPEDVTEASLRDLLAFMIELGEITKKVVILTYENWVKEPIFVYDTGGLRWLAILPASRPGS